MSHSTKFVHILNLLPLPQRSNRHFCAPFDLQTIQMGRYVLRIADKGKGGAFRERNPQRRQACCQHQRIEVAISRADEVKRIGGGFILHQKPVLLAFSDKVIEIITNSIV